MFLNSKKVRKKLSTKIFTCIKPHAAMCKTYQNMKKFKILKFPHFFRKQQIKIIQKRENKCNSTKNGLLSTSAIYITKIFVKIVFFFLKCFRQCGRKVQCFFLSFNKNVNYSSDWLDDNSPPAADTAAGILNFVKFDPSRGAPGHSTGSMGAVPFFAGLNVRSVHTRSVAYTKTAPYSPKRAIG